MAETLILIGGSTLIIWFGVSWISTLIAGFGLTGTANNAIAALVGALLIFGVTLIAASF